MRVTAIQAKTERKRQDKSARCAEKHRRRAGMLRVYGPIRPTSGVCATTDPARGGKRLTSWRSQAIFTSEGRPLGECRLNLLQIAVLMGAFILMFTVLGLRSTVLRGDFFLFLLSGVMFYMAHIKTFRAVSGAAGAVSGIMQHAPMTTAISITSAALGALYLQILSMAVALFVYHNLWTPIVIDDPIGALGMFLLAWFSGAAAGMVLLALSPWIPDFVAVITRVYIRINMIASGKMFVANQLPAYMIAMFDWNPLFHTIDQSRGFVFNNYFPHNTSIKYALLLSIGLLMIGLMGEFYSRQRISVSWGAKR